MAEQMRIVVGVTGASGTIYGWRLLERRRGSPSIETHLILSRSGERTAYLELGKQAQAFRALADCWYPVEDIGCRLASGSFPTNGMRIAACSVNTMLSIASG